MNKDLVESIDETIYSIKKILFQKDQDIFEKIDFYNNDIYLEPLLYSALLNGDSNDVDRILFSYYEKAYIKLNNIKYNNIYIPKIGYILIDDRYKNNHIYLAKNRNEIKIYNSLKEEIDFNISPIDYIFKEIEFLNTNDNLLEKLFINDEQNQVDVKFVNKIFYEEKFIKAFKIIEENSQSFYHSLIKVLKKVVFFEGEPYCFSSIQAHNTIFFNVDNESNELFFLEHLLHEGGHIIFNYLTFSSKTDLFNYEFDTKFSSIKGFENEHGDLYSRFHGIYTHYIISSNLYEIKKSKYFENDESKARELDGRLYFDLKKYKISLKLFSENILSEKGYELYNIFLKKYYDIKNSDLIDLDKYDFSNQPYMFSFKNFCKKNIRF